MKTRHAYSQCEYVIGPAMTRRSPFVFICMVCLILSASPGLTIAASKSEPTDPNAPAITEPNDLNTAQTRVSSAGPEPNQPSIRTIDDVNTTPLTSNSTLDSARCDWLIAGLPRTDLARKIWKDRITVPQEPDAVDQKKQLQQLIDRIRSIEFKPPEPPAEPIVVLKKPSPVEPNLTAVEPSDQNQPDTEHTITTKSQIPSLSEETLDILVRQLEKPELLKNPFELGEILFNAGRLNEAAVCYRQALTRIDPNQPDIEKKRPWILFQIGNCLRKSEPAKATQAYSQLITEHAGSLWAEPARAQADLIAWRQSEKPRLLVEQSRPKPLEIDTTLQNFIKKESESKTEPKTGEQTQDESQP